MIELNDVTKVYENGTVALDHVNLKIEDGQFVFIVGHSGAGKSTLLKLLLREEVPTSGQILVDGEDLAKIKKRKLPYYRRKLGVVFQDFRLFPDKNVYENIAFALQAVGARGSTIRRKVEATLRIVGLSEKAKCLPAQLSGGEQQRVALARALVNGPDIIIADEPTGNIDPKLSYEIMSLLVHIQKNRGKTVIVVTHEQHLVDYFRQRVVTISGGVIASDREGGMFAPEDDSELPASTGSENQENSDSSEDSEQNNVGNAKE